MGPDPLTVLIAPRVAPAASASAIGTSMCIVPARNAAHALTKNTRPGQSRAGMVRPRLIQRKSASVPASMVFSSPAYSARAISMTFVAMAPATPMRTSIARSSRWRSAARSPPR